MNGLSGISWAGVVAFGLFLLMIFQPWWWIMHGMTRRREREHAERMKAMEMGLPAPAPDSTWPRALVCIAIGALMPVGAFLCASLVTLNSPDVGMKGAVWGLSFMVSMVGVCCGTRLAIVLLGSRGRAEQANPAGKPLAFDPESFDTANHRG